MLKVLIMNTSINLLVSCVSRGQGRGHSTDLEDNIHSGDIEHEYQQTFVVTKTCQLNMIRDSQA